MRIVLTGAFVFRGRHYSAGECLELEDAVAVAAIDDGAAEQVFEVVAGTDDTPGNRGGMTDAGHEPGNGGGGSAKPGGEV